MCWYLETAVERDVLVLSLKVGDEEERELLSCRLAADADATKRDS